jgi:glucose/arabinose dehydrogenase
MLRPIIALLSVTSLAHAQSAPVLRLDPVVTTGLTQPLFVTAPRGDSRLFIVEKTGSIRLLKNGVLQSTPFLSVPVNTSSERGLLGLAFDPDFASNGHVYINYSAAAGNTVGVSTGTTVVARYTVDPANPDRVLSNSALTIITVSQDFSNHNGGWLDFSPKDGMLYIPMGDGGSGNDPNNRGQTTNTLLGKLLRIDPRTDAFPTSNLRHYSVPADNPFVGGTNTIDDPVWALGLRNPWRNTFDDNGDLYMADVGQGAREEVNYQPHTSPGAENYGWRLREGKIATPNPIGSTVGGPRPTGNVDPVMDYPRSVGSSITGGVVYRGEQLFPLIGAQYFFADYGSNIVRSMPVDQFQNLARTAAGQLDGFDLTAFSPVQINRTAQLTSSNGSPVNNFVSFGKDGAGEMYMVSINGGVYRIWADRLTADGDFDNLVDLSDFFILASNYGNAGNLNSGDYTRNGVVDVADLDLLIANFGNTPGGLNTSIPGLEAVRAFRTSVVPEPGTLALLAGFGVLLRRSR